MTQAEQLASFVVRASYDHISPAARQQLKIRVLDALSCAIGALDGLPVRLIRQQVTDFGDGGDAWECLQGFTFDLLLTDIVMPGMDGIELAKRAAERNGALKIMFITGFAAVALHPASGAPKQAKVLSKPFHLREIVAEVDRMLAAA